MNPLNHTQAQQYIQAAADNWLVDSERAALAAHLAACPDCHAYEERIGALEGNLRNLFHRQWDIPASRTINLLPDVRTRYRQRLARKQVFNYAGTLVAICLGVALLFFLNWFLYTRQHRIPAGNQTPTPTLIAPVSPTSTPPPLPQVTPSARLPQPGVNQSELTPPTGRLAFVSGRTEGADLYLMYADGSGQLKLFEGNISLSLSPSWSPDGNRLAFVSTRDGNSEIYTVSADGTAPTRLTDNQAVDTDPAWSPDGKKIAFSSLRSGYPEIYAMNPDGSNLTRLTYTQAMNNHPTWSPDGKSLAFASNRDGYWQIYRMNADGSEPVNLSNDPTRDDREPAWSPDGKWIAFSSKPVGTMDETLAMTKTDGTDFTHLIDPISSSGQPSGDYSPAWSPDSKWIAFWSYRDSPVYGDIYIIPLKNLPIPEAGIVRLTTEGGTHPAWKP